MLLFSSSCPSPSPLSPPLTLASLVQTVGKVLGEVETVKEIVVTGHSLGGALATIFTKGIYEHFPQVQDKSVHLTGYTYGGYGLGNKAWKEEFDGKIPNFYRCVDKGGGSVI